MLHSKLPNVGTTIFTVVNKMAREHNAINLAQGFPDFEVSPELIDLVYKHMKLGHNQYAHMYGVPELREAISQKIRTVYGTEYNPETQINVTAGGTQALFACITASINEGDEVILFEPAYDSYGPAVKLNGGKPVHIQMQAPDFRIDWEQVKKAISARTKMIVLNTPHNPTGSVLSDDDIKNLIKIVNGTKIIILSDEVYEHQVFDGQKHHSMAAYPELSKRSFVVSSFGKTFHATGWKVGYVVAPEDFMVEYRKVHQFEVFTVNAPIQYALAEYLQNENTYLQVAGMYQRKRDFFLSMLADTEFDIIPTQGSFFQCLNYGKITDLPDREFIEWLSREIGVAAIPLSAFYHQKTDNKLIRLCFAKSDETLERAAHLLRKVTK